MKATFNTLFYLMVLAFALDASAEKFTIFLPEWHFKKVSLESVHEARIDSEDDQEDLVIEYYSPAKQLATIDVDGLDLADLYSETRREDEVGPFFREVDIYLLRDGKGQWFLLHCEYDPGNRFRVGPLSPLSEKSEFFVLQGFMQASFHRLAEDLAKVAKTPESLERRTNMEKLMEKALRKLYKDELDAADQPANTVDSETEGNEKAKPEGEDRSK